MNFKHTFNAELQWSADTINRVAKTHRISIQGKQDLKVSAAKAFKGDADLLNPEDLLLSSLMSCHMMSYLYVCGQHKINVLSYHDNANALLETYPDGSGKIIEIHLNPHVIISDASQVDLALSLHEEANRLCFIANSCNFQVYHQPSCEPDNTSLHLEGK